MHKFLPSCVCLFAGAILLTLQATAALAALPPLEPEELEEQSTVIFTGGVESVQSKLVTRKKGFTDRVYQIAVQVDSVQKGEGKDIEAGKRVIVTCQQTAQRPRGFAGPQGQNFIPKKGDTVKLFCRGEKDQQFTLLEPNGIEEVDPKAKPVENEAAPK